MKAHYILRFDDICPTMNWTVWEQIESILAQHSIKPILAVVPDNRDPELMVDPARNDFWQKVKVWQEAGWAIALHGYQHLYTTEHSGLTNINNYSEFAGLPYEEQHEKIKQGIEIFKRYHIRPDAWIAPAHSFDELTVKALLDHGISIISDGYYFRPLKRLGAVWIPQQLWRFRYMPWGLWTVCVHHNDFSNRHYVHRFAENIEKFSQQIIPFSQALKYYSIKDYTYLDRITDLFWHGLLWLKNRR